MGYLFSFYFIVLDFATGLFKAFYKKEFSSKIMRQGLFHKAALMLVLLTAFMIDQAQTFVDLGVNIPVGAGACVYIILMEIGSSMENICQMNPDIMPDKLAQVFGGAGKKAELRENK